MVELKVNGQRRQVQAAEGTPLLYVLRNDLALTGTKVGCEQEQCGACTVLIDGEPRMSCRLPLSEAANRAVTTVEGLAGPQGLHPLQQAFLAENAAQCGYCTSGILMRAAALLEQNPSPDAAQMRHALRDNLCRCGAHNRVLRAIGRAAGELAAKGQKDAP